MTYFYIFIGSFILSVLFVGLSIAVCGKFKKFKKKGVPCLGGAGLYLAFLIVLLTATFFKSPDGSARFRLFLFSSGMMLILGFIDDIVDLRPYLKIIGEVLVIFLLVRSGIVTKIFFLPMWANSLATILWILFITNAFNLLDIMDGLASGLAVIISLTLLCIAVIKQDIFSSFALAALIGAHLGFLKYNFPPAKAYMGDAGSLATGFILAAVAINISYAPIERPVALITPILAMSLPIYDTLFLIIMRIKKRKPIFSKSNDHFALRLTVMGHSVKKSVWIMYFFSVFLAAASLITAFGSNIAGIAAFIIIILVFILAGKKIAIVRVD